MGSSTCFVYVFAAAAPFIAINTLGLSSSEYGLANTLPSVGLMLGSLIGARLSKKYSLKCMIQAGILTASLGSAWMFAAISMHFSALFSLFLPMMVIYFGLCFIMANASTIAMSHVDDKAHGSAVMNFINMGLATLVVSVTSLLPMKALLLPALFMALCALSLGLFKWTALPARDASPALSEPDNL